MATMYIGTGNKAKKIKNFYIGVGNQAKKVKKAYIGVNGKAKLFYSSSLPVILPSQYQLVEWIQPTNNSTAFFITDLQLSSDINLIFDIDMFTNYAKLGNIYKNGNIYQGLYLLKDREYIKIFCEGDTLNDYSIDEILSIDDQRHIWNLNDSNGNFWVDNILLGGENTFFEKSTPNLNFFRSYRSTEYEYSRYRLRHFQAYDNSTNKLIRDIYPCYIKASNTIILYDAVQDKTFNSTGSGLEKGNDII